MRAMVAMVQERAERRAELRASNGGHRSSLVVNDGGEPPMMSDEKAHLFLRAHGFETAYPFQYAGADAATSSQRGGVSSPSCGVVATRTLVCIAMCLGIRTGAELGHLRRAHAAWCGRELPYLYL